MFDLVLQQRIQALLQEPVNREDTGIDNDGVGVCMMWYSFLEFI